MINEIQYANHWNNIHEKEAKAKELYSMLDQLYTFTADMSKEDKVMAIKKAYLRDKVLTKEEYDIVKMYVEHGYCC